METVKKCGKSMAFVCNMSIGVDARSLLPTCAPEGWGWQLGRRAVSLERPCPRAFLLTSPAAHPHPQPQPRSMRTVSYCTLLVVAALVCIMLRGGKLFARSHRSFALNASDSTWRQRLGCACRCPWAQQGRDGRAGRPVQAVRTLYPALPAQHPPMLATTATPRSLAPQAAQGHVADPHPRLGPRQKGGAQLQLGRPAY